MLEIHDLTKQYRNPAGESVTVLNIKEFTVEKGEQIILSGPSGSGKTTLLHVIAGLVLPTGGTILWNGEQITGMPEKERDNWRAKHVGYIFQSFNLLPALSAEENILAAARFANKRTKKEQRSITLELLERVGLAGKAQSKPTKLSMGEQQRVAIARALVNDPALLLADEPTASLDRDNIDKVLSLMQTLCEEQGTTLLLATHDPLVMARFSRRYDMRAGGLIA